MPHAGNKCDDTNRFLFKYTFTSPTAGQILSQAFRAMSNEPSVSDTQITAPTYICRQCPRRLSSKIKIPVDTGIFIYAFLYISRANSKDTVRLSRFSIFIWPSLDVL